MQINGYKDEKKFIRAAAKACNLQSTSPQSANRLLVLSSLAGKTTEEFTCFHTLVPFQRAITNTQTEFPFGSRLFPTALAVRTTERWQKRFFYCRQCALEDIQFHGTSYWRRDHQITGQVWCPKHRIALSFVSEQREVLKSPSSHRTEEHTIEGGFVEETMKNAAVHRFLDIACELMQRKKSLPGVAAVLEIQIKAEKRGLYVPARKETRHLMSEFIRSAYPATWLALTIPQRANKAQKSPPEQIADVLVEKSRHWNSTAYLLLAAAIYDSSHEALARLVDCERRDQTEVRRSMRLRALTVGQPWSKDTGGKESSQVEVIIQTYAENYGHLPRIARSLNASVPQTSRILAHLGLPNLSKQAKTRGLLKVAGALCVDGMTLDECSKSTNVSLKELSKLDLQPDSILMRAWRRMLFVSPEEPDLTKTCLVPRRHYAQTVKA
jgi:hypothetical protein